MNIPYTLYLSTGESDPNFWGELIAQYVGYRSKEGLIREAKKEDDFVEEEVVWKRWSFPFGAGIIKDTRYTTIDMLFLVDGDTILRFVFVDGWMLENTDAKKSANWRWVQFGENL